MKNDKHDKYGKHDISVYVGSSASEGGKAYMLMKIGGTGKHKAEALIGVYIRLHLIIRRILNILSARIPSEMLTPAIKDAFVNIDAKTKEAYAEEYAEMERDIL